MSALGSGFGLCELVAGCLLQCQMGPTQIFKEIIEWSKQGTCDQPSPIPGDT